MTYWVIGGTSGIGAATAKMLYEESNCEVSATGAERDVCNFAAVRRHIDRFTESDLGDLQGVVYAAGVTALHKLERMELPQLWEAAGVLDVNLYGFINTISALAARYAAAAHPLSIVAVSSDAAVRPMRTSMAYCASKAGLDMAVKVAARELGPLGSRINAVSPGMTAPTGMSNYIDSRVPEVRGWTPEQAREYEESQEVVEGRIHPYEVATVIRDALFGPRHLNGSIITLNGGR